MSKGYYTNMIYMLIKLEFIHQVDEKKYNTENLLTLTIDDYERMIPHEITTDEVKIKNNILVPCDRSKDQIFCKNGILLVPPTFKEFLEILYAEVHEPFKDFIMAASRTLLINQLQFELSKGEKLLIEKTD